jgi:osmoprotectant transport system permease protein
VNFFSLVVAWFADPENWSGTTGVPNRLLEHMQYSVIAVAIAVVIAVPVGAFIGHTGRGGFFVVGVANGLRALPELGIVMLMVLAIGISLVSVVVALVILAVPPLLAGAYAGVRNVDRSVVDAARGMGMRERDVLLKVELPNALPLVFGGLRSAMLQVIATAAIAAFVSFGGLGRYLIDGLGVQDYTQMAAGAVLVAVLALAVEAILAGVQRLVVSPGLRDQRRKRRRPAAGPDSSALPESRSSPLPHLARS